MYYLYNLYICKWSKGAIKSGLISRGVLVLSSTTIIRKEFLILNTYALSCVYFGITKRTVGNVRIFSAVGS